MFSSLTLKGLYDKRWFTLGWLLGFSAMVSIMVGFYPSFSQDIGLDEIFKSVPPQFQAFVGDIASFKTVPGYVSTQIFDIRMPLISTVMVIILAVSIGVGEEDSGKLRQLMVQPISRGRILLEKWLTMVIVTTLLYTGMVLVLLTSLLPIDGWLEPSTAFALAALCGLLTLTSGTITFALGFATGRKGLTVGLVSLFVFTSFFISSFAKSVEWLKPVDVLSIFHYYNPTEITNQGLDWTNVFVLVTIIVVSLIIAWLGFRRRDITT